ncbi:hypothetical protein K7G90_001608 [Pasteurella canis]|uniref:hypothetical protein n=1 Tax=Pasteurella TaxID=745 RepID=UPI001CC596F6|nr:MULTISPECIES: hypothetical protein [Pasteurella]UAY77361.1 hypothetical protein K7G90_001608 [Pasteurella canis]WRK07858.1 hypothetical protein RFF38_03255 [Pasteurella multocida]HDX1124391.1 hypothetical protein [Pasteurella multocida]HDX1186276.1 hypothetical protein [Pasteurella multocida]
MAYQRVKKTIYAVYRGDTNIADGTAEELAKKLNKTVNNIQYLASRRNLALETPKRLIAIPIGYTTDEI